MAKRSAQGLPILNLENMSKRILIIFTLLLAVSVVAVWGVYQKYFTQEKVSPKVGNVLESIYGLGTVSADELFNMRIGVATNIGDLYVKEGDQVTRNTALIKIDGHIMRAPIDGTVTRIAYKKGELVAQQVPIVTLVNLKLLYLEVNLEQQSVLRIKEGQKAYVSFETLRNEKYTGQVKTVYPRESQFIVRIELEKWPEGILPGMTADVAIAIGHKKDVLLIPINSINSGQVTRLRNGRKEKLAVKLGAIDGEMAEVTSENISETDELIIRKK